MRHITLLLGTTILIASIGVAHGQQVALNDGVQISSSADARISSSNLEPSKDNRAQLSSVFAPSRARDADPVSLASVTVGRDVALSDANNVLAERVMALEKLVQALATKVEVIETTIAKKNGSR